MQVLISARGCEFAHLPRVLQYAVSWILPASVLPASSFARSRIESRRSNLLEDRAMKIYVGNLSFTTEDHELQALFTPFGHVDSVRLGRDHATGRSRGFGFVEMADSNEGRAACTALDQQEFEGRRLTVNEARPQEQRSNRGPGGGGGFGRKKRDNRW
jgi:cold-inducible RNA-binding protein